MPTKASTLIPPYGGQLVNLLVPAADVDELKAYASHLPSLQLSSRALCDLELLAVGGFSPLERFMGQADYQAVLDDMRLSNGYIFPIPITLPVKEEELALLTLGQDVALRNAKNELLAVSPYRATRNDVRNMVGKNNYIEVFVDTPLDICEDRDVKGFYAKARRGEIKNFTGIDDPYERPQHAEVVLNTVDHTPQENAYKILHYLKERGFVRSDEKL